MKDIKKRVKRAISLLQDSRGSSIKSIIKLLNDEEPSLELKTILHILHDEVKKGHLIARDGRFKLVQQEEDALEDYDFDEVEEDDEDDDDEEDEEDEMEEYMGMKAVMDGPDHPKGDKEKDKPKDDKSKALEPPKTENENTAAQPYEAKCYPCTKKRKRSACPKKKKRGCPMKKKRNGCPKKKKSRGCPKKKRSSCPKKRHSCPKKKKPSCPKKKPSCPKKKPSCPSKRKPKKCNMDDEEDDREVKATTPVASFNSFEFGSKSSLRNRMDRVDLKKQIRGPRCTSMKKEIRLPSRVQLPLVNPTAMPQKTYDELARRSPEPVSGPLFDENKQMIVDSEMPSFSFPQIQ